MSFFDGYTVDDAERCCLEAVQRLSYYIQLLCLPPLQSYSKQRTMTVNKAAKYTR